IEAGAEIVDSVVRGPAIIGSKSRIVNSYVGPFTSVYHGVEILNSEIEHSIVLENSKIIDVQPRIEERLIANDVVIRRTHQLPQRGLTPASPRSAPSQRARCCRRRGR